jgi:NAD-dependent deacetylase
MKSKKIVILTGAGISQESGISTFRDANGLWENHDIMEVASPQGWQKTPELVLEFYNQRRRQLFGIQPNKAHYAITELQKHFDVQVITQNVDDLHERAGNAHVHHLHGELLKVKSDKNDTLIYEWKKDLHIGDTAEDGAQLRPDIVWFGVAVPMINKVIPIVQQADIFIIVGTGMQVYPAAGLIDFLDQNVHIYYIDPNPSAVYSDNPLTVIDQKAGTALPVLVKKLINENNSDEETKI